jgi:hypothetical protein
MIMSVHHTLPDAEIWLEAACMQIEEDVDTKKRCFTRRVGNEMLEGYEYVKSNQEVHQTVFIQRVESSDGCVVGSVER